MNQIWWLVWWSDESSYLVHLPVMYSFEVFPLFLFCLSRHRTWGGGVCGEFAARQRCARPWNSYPQPPESPWGRFESLSTMGTASTRRRPKIGTDKIFLVSEWKVKVDMPVLQLMYHIFRLTPRGGGLNVSEGVGPVLLSECPNFFYTLCHLHILWLKHHLSPWPVKLILDSTCCTIAL